MAVDGVSVFQVSDFTWSHDGTQALIAYRDGFVLVGSVSGQRHWSSEINLESQITCGIWTPDDQQVNVLITVDLPPSLRSVLASLWTRVFLFWSDVMPPDEELCQMLLVRFCLVQRMVR